jgi:thiamine pyrophosphate-dependent acetolactate synthase large subunit-like protein
MLLGDLGTIATYDLPVKVIVFNNGLLDMGQWEMPAEGFEPFQTDLKNPDFAKLADACLPAARRPAAVGHPPIQLPLRPGRE